MNSLAAFCTACEVLQSAMQLLIVSLEGVGGDPFPIATVHDEILVEVDTDHAEQIKSNLEKAMCTGWLNIFPDREDLTKDLVDAKVGPNWFAIK